VGPLLSPHLSAPVLSEWSNRARTGGATRCLFHFAYQQRTTCGSSAPGVPLATRWRQVRGKKTAWMGL